MRLPDTIEKLEMAAEEWADDHIIGDSFICGCGKMCKLNEGETVSSNPYASPVCPECFEEWFNLQEKMNLNILKEENIRNES
ncbi:MAG: hypothetical protein J7L15_07440 [Clostridiales bacterium]|nr:hypothetical protein [Clostridiales bacterium]